MSTIRPTLLAFLAILLLLVPAGATLQNVVSFGCIAFSSCTGGSLESYNGSAMTPGNIVSVGGYVQPGDSGGGEFVVLGQEPSVCNGYTASNATGIVGSTTIPLNPTYPTGLTVGELVGGSGTGTGGTTIQVPQGSEIASITISGSPPEITAISLTLPLTGNAPGSTNINLAISGNNGGTLITDSYVNYPVGANCYQKTNYRGDPHEFAALGDGVTDDTIPLENWFGAYGNVNANLAPTTAPNAFGPWIATVPATYIVNTPLTCPQNATVQGTVNLTNSNPVVAIEAASGQTLAGTGSQDWFSGTLPANETASNSGAISAQAVIGALAYCRLTGISVIGNGYYAPTTGTTTTGTP
jgi:hypothetical protein